MNVIWKFEVVPGAQSIAFPGKTRPIHVGIDGQNIMCLWAICDTEEPARDYRVTLWPTGSWYKSAPEFVGTIIQPGTGFVWHVFFDGEVK